MKIKILGIQILSVLMLFILLNSGCKKKSDVKTSDPTYSSLQDFYAQNGAKSQFFNINATTGGSFVTANGTTVTIKPNSFVNDANSNIPISGTVKIEFLDLYKKSDMLLTQMLPMLQNGAPLLSAGEFFIKATNADSVPINIADKNSIVIQQPVNGKVNAGMKPFVVSPDSANNPQWVPTHLDSLNDLADNYIFSLYKFTSPVGNGTWCNSDNDSYFSTFSQTTLNINPGFNIADFNNYVDVYLVFKGLNAMVHVYNYSGFIYDYAPVGLPCTIVVVGVKDNNLWASFTPIDISKNQTVTIPISQTTKSSFVSTLKGLDN